eukprot:6595729-Prymnesium_polylepis.1
MFLSDFEDAFFLAESPAPAGQVCAVRRVFPTDWEIWTAGDRQAFQVDGGAAEQLHAMRRSRTSKGRPNAAEMLCRQATSMRHSLEESRRGKGGG